MNVSCAKHPRRFSSATIVHLLPVFERPRAFFGSQSRLDGVGRLMSKGISAPAAPINISPINIWILKVLACEGSGATNPKSACSTSEILMFISQCSLGSRAREPGPLSGWNIEASTATNKAGAVSMALEQKKIPIDWKWLRVRSRVWGCVKNCCRIVAAM